VQLNGADMHVYLARSLVRAFRNLDRFIMVGGRVIEENWRNFATQSARV